MTGDNRPIVDPRRVACVGGGTHAVVAIGPQGDTVLWLMGPDLDGDTYGNAGPQAAPHEQTGPLPPLYRHRLRAVLLTCGAPTITTGRPCRYPVTRPGDRCHHHRHQETHP